MSARLLKRGRLGTPLPLLEPSSTPTTCDLQLDTRHPLATGAYSATRQLQEWKQARVPMVRMCANARLRRVPFGAHPNRTFLRTYFHPALFRGVVGADLLEPGSTFKPDQPGIALQEKAVSQRQINDSAP